jgi:hypothetical protein
VIDVDLPALGAKPLRKDLFVEVDWMAGMAPEPSVWPAAEATFAAVPVFNPDGSRGIALHVDHGQSGAGGGGGTVLPLTRYLGYGDENPDPSQPYVDLHRLKAMPLNFFKSRLKIYRYCIFADDNALAHGSSGQSEAIWGNDFFVSLGSWGSEGKQVTVQLGTFLHELGHTLNLRHGGFEDRNYKPNYNSVMRYSDSSGVGPGQTTGIDVDCNLDNVDSVFTYSDGVRAGLNELELDERLGVCDHIARDWNGNGRIEPSVRVSIDGERDLAIFRDHCDWGYIELDFRSACSQWGGN